MSRGLDRTDEREPAAPSASPDVSAGGRHTTTGIARRSRDRHEDARDQAVSLPVGRQREPVSCEDRVYRLRGSESRTLEAVATFRVVLERDLGAGLYRGAQGRLTEDVRSLREQGLVQRSALVATRRGGTQGVVALTVAGQRLLRDHRGPSELSDRRPARPDAPGVGKRTDLVHNASLYRMYQLEAARLTADGARLRRVLLDDDLKRAVYRDLNVDGPLTAADRQARPADLAAEHDLSVVNGHVQLPDVRIEYETAAGERGRVDLELSTDHYRPGQIAAKQQAGFTVYRASGQAGRGLVSLGSGASGGAGGRSPDHSFLSGLLSL